MKTRFALLLIVITFSFSLYSQSKSSNTVIKGKLLNNKYYNKVFIDKMGKTVQLLATSAIDTAGNFSLNFDVDKTGFYKLRFDNKFNQLLVLSPGENITFSTSLKDFQGKMDLKGSPESEIIVEAQKAVNDFKRRNDSLDMVFKTNVNQYNADSLRTAISAEAQKIEYERVLYLHNYIVKHDKSLSGLIFIEQLNIDNYLSTYSILDNGLFPKYSDNEYVISFHNKVGAAQRTAIGMPAPEIVLPDTSGNLLKLSSLLGKVVVIDFWASWCGPCRHENPNKVAIFNKYNSKGLAFFSISLDKDRNSWIQGIRNDKLTWNQVSDLKYFQSEAAILYGVTSIPMMFIMDTKGYIVAKGLRGQQLEAKIVELLGQ